MSRQTTMSDVYDKNLGLVLRTIAPTLRCPTPYIYFIGFAVNSESPYFIVAKDKGEKPQVYHLGDPLTLLYEIPYNNVDKVLYATENIAIFTHDQQLMVYHPASSQCEIYTEANAILSQDINIETEQTNLLIEKYIDHGFIPIVTRSNTAYLFDTQGRFLETFKKKEDMESYIQDRINRMDNDISIMM